MGIFDDGYVERKKKEIEEKAAKKKAAKEGATNLENADALGAIAMQRTVALQDRVAPTAQRTQLGAPSQFATGQARLADRLEGISSGNQMGAGEMAVRRQGQQAFAQNLAQSNSMRGANAGLGARAAARQNASLGTTLAGQAQGAAMQDQSTANAQLAGVLGQGRSMDQASQFQQAGLNQQTSLANMQAQLQQSGMNDQAALQYMAQLHGMDATEMQARMQWELQQQQLAAQRRAENMALAGGFVSSAGAVGAGIATSDIRAKENITSGESLAASLLDSIAPYEYDYKDGKKHGKGRQLSVMAQDLERTPLGHAMVKEVDGVKVVDYGKGLGAMLAAQASLHKRLKKIENGD